MPLPNGFIPTPRPARFPLGRLVITSHALERLNHEAVHAGLARHVTGDWGEVDTEDWGANERALQTGERLLSVYTATDGTKFWIITEWDRSLTTVLLPEDY
ncbi:MAG: hypothetical protein HY286_09300 [Planctomycetes bacterium]|nr:hypothetical protein [Planctomycetota bacterium]